MREYLYVSLKDDDKLLVYSLQDGLPVLCSSCKIAGGPGPMAVNPGHDRLFVGLRTSRELLCLEILAEGRLAVKGSCALPSDPCFVGTDKTGGFILSAYYRAGQIAVHRWIEEENTFQAVQRLTTENKAHSLRLDAENRYAYAPHTDTNKIYLYDFDAKSGMLSSRDPAWISPGENLQPRHICFHPSLPFLYVVNEGSSTVSVYDFNNRNGAIALKTTVSTLTDKFEGNLCAELRISSDGNFLYASNRGHDSIACFKINRAAGIPERTCLIPAPKTPRSFDLSADGNYLYAAGQDSGELAVYKLDQSSGLPVELSRSFIGNCPMWAMTVC
jgi:6-phosphogluconolactonase